MTDIDSGSAVFSVSLIDSLTLDLKTTLGDAVSAINTVATRIESEMQGIANQVQSTANQVAGLGAAAAAFGGAASLGFVSATLASGTFAENLSKFEAVFKEQSDAVRDWAKTYAKEVGRSEAMLIGFLARSQDTFVPLGFDRQEAAELSKTITSLAVDLASFNPEVSEDQAITRLLSSITGNVENLKAFGVVANQATIEAEALAQGFDPSNLTAYEKALAILAITTKGTKDAQGDAARTSGSLENSLKALRAELERLQLAIGDSLRGIAIALVQAFSFVVGIVADLLTQFPILTKFAAALSAAMVVLGAAVTVVATAISLMVGSIITGGLLAFAPLLIQAAGGATLLSGALVAIGTKVAAIGALVVKVFSIAAIKLFFAKVVIGFQTILIAAKVALAFIIKSLIRIATISLASPWVLLAAGIATATKALELYYKKQLDEEKRLGQDLERRRQAIVGQSFRDAGQAVPADLGKTLDVNNASVIGPVTLSKADQELAAAIKNSKTSLEEFNEKIAGINRLLERGTINQDQAKKAAAEELATFRKNDPTIQARDSLRESIQTPAEVLTAALEKAAKLFADEPAMFERARIAAIENFKANDAATRLADQLKTPLERFNGTIAEARKLFANDPLNLKRAEQAARDQFRAEDPLALLIESLKTPAQQLQDRFAEIDMILRNAGIALDGNLAKRAKDQAREQFENSDPDLIAAKEIIDSIKTDAQRVAEEIGEAAQLVGKGIDRDQFNLFKANAIEGFLGEGDIGNALTKSIQASSAFAAERLSNSAPTFDVDKEILERQKKQVELQKEMKNELTKIRKKKAVLA